MNMINQLLNGTSKAILKKACETYGYQTQIAIAMEELNEFSVAVLEHVTFNSDNSEEMFGEFCDAVVVLRNLIYIYNITDEEIEVARKNTKNRGRIKNHNAEAVISANKLSMKLAKFYRYTTVEKGIEETRERVVQEAASLIEILQRFKNAYKYPDKQIGYMTERKCLRVKRWLDQSDNLEISKTDRGID